MGEAVRHGLPQTRVIDHRPAPGLDRDGGLAAAVAEAPDDVVFIPGDLGVDGEPQGQDQDGGQDGLTDGQAGDVTANIYGYE